MMGIQKSMADDLFYALATAREEEGPTVPVDLGSVKVLIAFFEIYGGRCQVRLPKCKHPWQIW